MLTLKKAESLISMMRQAGIQDPDMEYDIGRSAQLLEMLTTPRPPPVTVAQPKVVKQSSTCGDCDGTGWSKSTRGRCYRCKGTGKVFE